MHFNTAASSSSMVGADAALWAVRVDSGAVTRIEEDAKVP
jgi:hypothetical protein